MPGFKTSGPYRPTYELTDEQREHPNYGHKIIDRILRQEGRPHVIRKRKFKKADLIQCWIAQDEAIKDAGGQLAQYYKRVVGQDGFLPHEWAEIEQEKQRIAERGRRNKVMTRLVTASETPQPPKRKRTAPKKGLRTKRAKKVHEKVEESDLKRSASRSSEEREGTDVEMDGSGDDNTPDTELSLSNAARKKPLSKTAEDVRTVTFPRTRSTKQLLGFTKSVNSGLSQYRRSRTRQQEVTVQTHSVDQAGLQRPTTADMSDAEDDFVVKSHHSDFESTVIKPSAQRAPVNERPAKTVKGATDLSRPRYIRKMKNGLPGPYKRFHEAMVDSSGGSQNDTHDNTSSSEDDVIANIRHIIAKISRKSVVGNERSTKSRHARVLKGAIHKLSLKAPYKSHSKARKIFEEFTEEEGSDDNIPNYSKTPK
jgi:hypothetical protein